mgnify:CR=1 FL=1
MGWVTSVPASKWAAVSRYAMAVSLQAGTDAGVLAAFSGAPDRPVASAAEARRHWRERSA